jgi:hypothetical protein
MEWTLSEEQQFLDSLPQSQRLFCGPDNLDEEEAAAYTKLFKRVAIKHRNRLNEYERLQVKCVYEINPDRQALEAIVRSWDTE